MTELTSRTLGLLAHLVRDERRREIVGFVLGADDGDQELISARNWAEQNACFFVAAGELERIERHARRRGLDIQAIVHSHRSSLELSAADAEELGAGSIPWIVVVPRGDGVEYRIHTPRPAVPR